MIEPNKKIKGNGLSFFSYAMLLIFAVTASSGCGVNTNIAIYKPVASDFAYGSSVRGPIKIYVEDARPKGEKSLTRGVLKEGKVVILGIDDPVAFIGESLVAELNARGINAELGSAEAGGIDAMVIRIDRYYYRHHNNWTTGWPYRPWDTFTNFRASVDYKGKRAVVASYFNESKTMTFSTNEAAYSTYNVPTGMLVKEVATKLNRIYFHLESPPRLVKKKLSTAMAEKDCPSIMKIAFLGSKDALAELETLARDGESNTITCAINAIGIIGDPGSLEFLKSLYTSTASRAKLLSLKAIGDLGPREALEFVRSQPRDMHHDFLEIVDLYTY